MSDDTISIISNIGNNIINNLNWNSKGRPKMQKQLELNSVSELKSAIRTRGIEVEDNLDKDVLIDELIMNYKEELEMKSDRDKQSLPNIASSEYLFFSYDKEAHSS